VHAVNDYIRIERPGGGSIEVLADSFESERLLVFHNGTPGAAVRYPHLIDAARAAGVRLVSYSRPGYGESSPRPGRSVADAAADVAALLDSLGAQTFLTIGWSGGGPHALACAALLPDRCRAACSLAGVAPYAAEGLDWMGGMGPENVEEFGAAIAGEAVLVPELERFREQLTSVKGAEVATSLGGLVSDVDKRSLTGEFAESVAASFRRGVSHGIAGWRDDDLAFVGDWGFDLSQINRPVAVWQGAEDRMVPFAHGQWLATHIPGARAHLYPKEGHLSLVVAAIDRIVADLVELGYT
jgi:pimeloyl-ACP methyl ester carboxylesterase